jgi:hypothetical protein
MSHKQFFLSHNKYKKITVFWVVAACSLVKFANISELLAASIIRAMMEAASTSEASVNYYQIIRRNNPEDSHFHTRRHEKLKSSLHFSVTFRSCFTMCALFCQKIVIFDRNM